MEETAFEPMKTIMFSLAQFEIRDGLDIRLLSGNPDIQHTFKYPANQPDIQFCISYICSVFKEYLV